MTALLRAESHAGPTRAVAAVSTGGYGVLAFAARRPGAFAAAASYSGIPDTAASGMPAVVDAIVVREGRAPSTLWGNASRSTRTGPRTTPTGSRTA